MGFAWSYSRLSDFEGCPLMFQHKYILKTIKFVTNEAMERGKDRHKQLEHNTVRAIHGKPCVPGDVEHVQPIIEKFVQTHQEVVVEQQIAFDANLNVVDWFSKQAWFRAIFDLAGRTNVTSGIQNQQASIVDWKTGQYRPQEDQLKIFNLAALLLWSQVIQVSSSLVFIDHKKSTKPLITKRVQGLPLLLEEFSERAEAIQIAIERDDWPAKKNFRCGWCGVNDCQYVTR